MDDLLEALQFAEARLEELGEHELVGKCAAAFAKYKAKQGPEEQLSELGYAARLARELCKKHYPDCSENWKPLDSLYGVLTQIDNMVSGLIRNTQSVQEPVAIDWEPLQNFWRNNSGIDWGELESAVKCAVAAPVRTKDLTDDEWQQLFNSKGVYLQTEHAGEVARAVIAADRRKNK